MALKATLYLNLLVLLISTLIPGLLRAEELRFFLMGNGEIVLAGQKISFRKADGSYNPASLKRINQIFKAPWGKPGEQLSLRFIEVLDYVQDQMEGGSYRIRSGYRSPRINQSLRNKGKLAAQSSMHVEAAAGDLILSKIPSGDVFQFVKALDCCGIGWYHSRHFHLDTGPSRYWDEKTSKTRDKTPQQNSKLILQPDFDRYFPGETIQLKFMRITEYPIGVNPQIALVPVENTPETKGVPLDLMIRDLPAELKACPLIQDRSQARSPTVSLPKKDIPPGFYRLRVKFCNRFHYEKMPEEILSRKFEILLKKGHSP